MFTEHDTPEHVCGGVADQCMGDEDFVAALGEGRTGVCCEEGLRCVFIEPFLGVCADPTLFTESVAEAPGAVAEAPGAVAEVPIEEIVLDTRPRTIAEDEKCGGTEFGTTEDQCLEGLFCQYQEPVFAKCVTCLLYTSPSPRD